MPTVEYQEEVRVGDVLKTTRSFRLQMSGQVDGAVLVLSTSYAIK